MTPHGDTAANSLAEKIQRLRDIYRREGDGEMYSISEIAREVTRLYVEDLVAARTAEMKAAGASAQDIERMVEETRQERLLDRTYLGDLIRGRRDNPTKYVIKYLARFFGVSPAYFFSDGDATDDTRDAEKEVEALANFRRLKERLSAEGGVDGAELLGALMRGGVEADPRVVAGMLQLQVALLKKSTRE